MSGQSRLGRASLSVQERVVVGQPPNPSIERTRTGRPRMALISFWALRVLPSRAAHVKR